MGKKQKKKRGFKKRGGGEETHTRNLILFVARIIITILIGFVSRIIVRIRSYCFLFLPFSLWNFLCLCFPPFFIYPCLFLSLSFFSDNNQNSNSFCFSDNNKNSNSYYIPKNSQSFCFSDHNNDSIWVCFSDSSKNSNSFCLSDINEKSNSLCFSGINRNSNSYSGATAALFSTSLSFPLLLKPNFFFFKNPPLF